MEFLIWTLAVMIFVAGGLVASALLRFYTQRFLRPEKLENYECGETPAGGGWKSFSVYFLKLAILFAIFDAEIIFILPWIYALENIKTFLLMLVFFLVLFAGLLWMGVKGYLKAE